MSDGCFTIKNMFSVSKKQIDFCHRVTPLYNPYLTMCSMWTELCLLMDLCSANQFEKDRTKMHEQAQFFCLENFWISTFYFLLIVDSL